MAHKHPLRPRIKRGLSREVYILGVAAVISLVSGVVASLTNIWNYVYTDDFGLSPANASLAASNLNIPWTIKPLWGILCDNVPIFGYRRKSYLIIMSILGFVPLFLFGLGTPATGILGLGILLVLHLSMAFQSVIGQALVAENSQEVNKRSDISEEEKTRVASRGVSLFFGCKYFGQIIFSIIATAWLEEDRRHTFLFYTSFILITVFAASFLIQEKSKKLKKREVTARLGSLIEASVDGSLLPILPSQQQVADLENRSPLENLKKTWNFVKIPVVYQSMILAFLGNFAPGFTQPKFSYYTKHLGFEAGFMSTLTLLTSVATVCGIIMYDRFFRNINIKKYYTCTIILYFLLKLSLLLLIFRISTDIGIPDKVFAAFDQFVTDLGGELNALPVLILACRICPKNIEATIFSLLLAFNNASGLLSADMGAGIVSALGITNENFDNLWVTSVVAAFCQLLPFLVLFRIDYKKAIKMAEESHKQNGQEAETPAVVDDKEKENENDLGFPIEQDEGLGQNKNQSRERPLLQKGSSFSF